MIDTDTRAQALARAPRLRSQADPASDGYARNFAASAALADLRELAPKIRDERFHRPRSLVEFGGPGVDASRERLHGGVRGYVRASFAEAACRM